MANLSKRVYFNLFRHSEATIMANFLTEAQMRKRHGWTSDSEMPGRYVHLVNADVDEAIFKHYGIKNAQEEKQNLPQKCFFCEVANAPEAKICSKCGKPLDIAAAIHMDKNYEETKMVIEDLKKEISVLKTNYSHVVAALE